MKIFHFNKKKSNLFATGLERAKQLGLITELEKLELKKQRATKELEDYLKRDKIKFKK